MSQLGRFLKDKTILITGGTGSLGQVLVRQILDNHPSCKVTVFSRDEDKQVAMRRQIPKNGMVRYFIGDVRDRDRLYRAFAGVDYVVHTAAMKHVDICEFDPFEALKTNAIGMQHIADAAIDRGVKKVLAVSSDKSVNPINLYGATKLCADKLTVASNAYVKDGRTKLSVVRFGNFIGSRGSIIPYFEDLISQGERELPVTSFDMTRFFLPIEEAASLTLDILDTMQGAEIFTPKMKAYRLVDFLKSHFPDADFKEVGIRDGEKLHEDLITEDDARHTYEDGRWYVTTKRDLGLPRVPDSFNYSSRRGLPWRD